MISCRTLHRICINGSRQIFFYFIFGFWLFFKRMIFSLTDVQRGSSCGICNLKQARTMFRTIAGVVSKTVGRSHQPFQAFLSLTSSLHLRCVRTYCIRRAGVFPSPFNKRRKMSCAQDDSECLLRCSSLSKSRQTKGRRSANGGCLTQQQKSLHSEMFRSLVWWWKRSRCFI